MKILFVSRFLPHEGVRDSGGQDTYHYIVDLGKEHEISLIAFAAPGQESAIQSMRSHCRDVVIVPYQPDAFVARLWRALWRLLLPRVYGRNVSLGYRNRLREFLQREHFDVVIIDGMMAMYRSMIAAPAVLDEVDVYGVVAYHDYLNSRGKVQRLLNYLDWIRTQLFELHYVRSCSGVMARSEKDAAFLRNYLPRQQVHVVAPWFEGLDELQRVVARRPSGNNLLFVGAMQNPKNVEAAFFLPTLSCHIYLRRYQMPSFTW